MIKTNILINGFGRIGRAILRKLSIKNFASTIYVNDLNEDINNLIYTYNFDKLVHLYKKFPKIIKKNNNFYINKKKIIFRNAEKIKFFANIKNLDLVIDCSGVSSNSKEWMQLSKTRSKIKFLYTFDHPINEFTMVLGANENDLISKYKFISASICDATALAPFLKLIDKNFKISHGNITTVHPILNYQNLLDGRSASWSDPGKTYSHYGLGRSALDNLIPKPTTAIKIAQKSLPYINLSSVNNFSYRVPTSVVGSADITLILKKNFTLKNILKLLKTEISKQKFNIFSINQQPTISSDYFTCDFSLVYDERWSAKQKNMLHAVLWYDNENGYASRVVDQAYLITKNIKKK